tara:strand:+ start:92 stop:583 length:492 start_codon:yes stop_codon:yes gene_type:complete
MKIKLTKQEMLVGCMTGFTRHIESITKGMTLRFPEQFPGQVLLNNQLACCAEMAYAKMSGVYFSHSVNTFHIPDVGDNIEVRFSNMEKLKVRITDKDVYVVSMSGNLPEFVYNGFIWCEDAKNPLWERDYNNLGKPAYFVPLSELDSSIVNTKNEQEQIRMFG